ncbi:CARDB domain-containing protein [Chloroflexota bacterium]
MRKATIFIVVALLLTLCSVPVYASTPLLPHAFYGNVTINGSPASTGTTVEARGEGVLTGIAGNPIKVTETGKYGGPGGLDPKLVVQGDIADEATITFYVNGKNTGETYHFDSGETTELPLSVTITEPSEPSAPRPSTIETSIFGIEGSFRISSTGEILETIIATSADGMFTMTIEEGTIALDAEGKPLKTLTVVVELNPPEPPEDFYIIGLAYDFSPDGATFDPGITFEYTYDPAELPGGVAEADLVMAFYDTGVGEWVTCDCTCDPEANCITACVCHFTTFATIGMVIPPEEEEILPPEEEIVPPEEEVAPAPAVFSVSSLSVQPTEVEPGEMVTIAVSVANTGGELGSYAVVLKINGVKEAEEMVIIAAGSSQEVTFSVTKEEVDSYTITMDGLSGSFTVIAPPSRINWPLIGGIIGGVVVVGLLIFVYLRRRAY